MKHRKLSLACTALAMAVLILDSRRTMSAAADAIDLCIRTVIPSLFPFFILSIYLTGNLGARSAVGSVLTAGFLGGYPVGAQAAAESWHKGFLTKEEADRLLMFCSQAGPSFLFGMVTAQFPNMEYSWKLWIVQLVSALSVGLLVRKEESINDAPAITGTSLPMAMKKSTQAMASVCGWVVIFRVLLGYLPLLPLADSLRILLSGILELANGCLLLGQIPDVPLRFLVAAVMLNFGGICVLLQTASVAQGLNIRRYFFGKLLQSGFSLCYGLCIMGIFWGLIPPILAFLLFSKGILRKNSSIPAGVGV